MEMMKKIAVILVTFNPDIDSIKKLVNELDEFSIYISDNGSNNIETLKKISLNSTNVCLIMNKRNLGIAKAQNLAMEKACEEKIEFFFFLDQDSFITSNQLIKLEKDYLNSKINKLAILSASTENRKEQFGILPTNEVISSGMLVSVEYYKKVGGMMEELFIDMVDFEWCWRFRKLKYQIAVDYDVDFEHQIGNKNMVLGKYVVSPFRLYYVFRNSLFLILHRKTVDFKQDIKLLYRLFKQVIFNVFFCSQKLARFKYIFFGIRDAFRGKMGKFK